MNFAYMPELTHVWGYPVALLTMIISAIIPWLWFKRSGWF
jgi:magnesium transporter